METLKPASFVIDVLTIKKRAGKPHHVEARFARRNKENFCEYVNRRNAFIEARKSKLERRGAHVKQVLAEQKKRDDGASTAALTRISDAIQAAEQKRKEIIERQKQVCCVFVSVRRGEETVPCDFLNQKKRVAKGAFNETTTLLVKKIVY